MEAYLLHIMFIYNPLPFITRGIQHPEPLFPAPLGMDLKYHGIVSVKLQVQDSTCLPYGTQRFTSLLIFI